MRFQMQPELLTDWEERCCNTAKYVKNKVFFWTFKHGNLFYQNFKKQKTM